jgi:hypothetical protein
MVHEQRLRVRFRCSDCGQPDHDPIFTLLSGLSRALKAGRDLKLICFACAKRQAGAEDEA